MKKIQRGVIIGRFNPPHNGHKYLIDFASSFVDELYIFVCTLSRDEIPGDLRFQWMKELYPDAHNIHITEENPDANRKQPNAHKIWADAVQRHMKHAGAGEGADYLFASEEYGWNLAGELGAEFIPVDPNRDQLPVSGSDIRNHPLNYWDFLPETVRPYFIKRIGILAGKESEALARQVAGRTGSLYAPSYRRYYNEILRSHNKHTTIHETPEETIHHAQRAMEQALSRQARRFLFLSCSGDPEDLRSEIAARRFDRLVVVESLMDSREREDVLEVIQSDREISSRTSFFHFSAKLSDTIHSDLLDAFHIRGPAAPAD